MANYQLSVSNAISTGWDYTKKYLLVVAVYVGVGIVTSGICSIPNGFGPTIDPSVIDQATHAADYGDWPAYWAAMTQIFMVSFSNIFAFISSIISSIIGLIVGVGLYNLALGLMSGRFTEVTFDAFKLPVGVFVKVFFVEILVSIICFFSTLFCILPVFFVAPRVIMAPVYQIDHPEASVFDSISQTWKMTSGNTFSMLGLGIALFFITILGFCCCCVGAYFAEAIALFATVSAYYQLKGNLQ